MRLRDGSSLEHVLELKVRILGSDSQTLISFLNLQLDSSKLQTLEEENDTIQEVDEENEDFMIQKPSISQNMINILLEQANSEGIVDLSNMTDSRARKCESMFKDSCEINTSDP